MLDMRLDLQNWLTENDEVVASTIALVGTLCEHSPAPGMAIASWYDMMLSFAELNARQDAAAMINEIVGR